jgi:SAM-dependent MidA family methyltransferase
MQEDEEDDPDFVPKVEFSAFAKELAERIKKSGGALTLADYMGACIAEYYSTRKPFGKKGDFITSPEVSQMFGELIGAWIADLWTQMGKPEKAMIVEMGPGRGTLSADIMRILSTWPDCRAAMSLHLVENSLALREEQREAVKPYGVEPTFYDRFEDVPPGPLFVIANEFLDALPVRQYVRKNKKWHEKMVIFDEAKGEFTFMLRKDPTDTTPPKGYPKPIERDIFEVNDGARAVVEMVAKRIAEHNGAALFIDYGEGTPTYGDTIQSYKRHKRVDCLRNPGGQDVTANVDFPALVAVAEPFVNVHGPVMQGEFLMRLGIVERAEALCLSTNDPIIRGKERLAVRRLTSGTDMGAKFKILGLSKKDSGVKPEGFK